MSNPKPKQSPCIDMDAFGRYPSTYDPIPLNKHSTLRDFGGKPRNVGKAPRDRNWPTRSYEREEVLAAARAGHNVGIRLGATDLVVDIDPRSGGDVSWDQFCVDYNLTEQAKTWPKVITGSGGAHYYLRKPADITVRDSLGDEYPGLEFKSLGRQVVAAGSIHPESKSLYTWDDTHPAIEEGTPDAPPALLDRIRKPERDTAAVGGGTYSPAEIAEILEHINPLDFHQKHDEWLRLMMGVHFGSAGTARTEWIRWSSRDTKFDADEIGGRWDSLDREKPGAVTMNSLRPYLAKVGMAHLLKSEPVDPKEFPDDLPAESEDDFDFDTPAVLPSESRGLRLRGNTSVAADTFENACVAIRRLGIAPAWNELTQNATFQGTLPWDESYGREVNDHTLRALRLALIDKYRGNAFDPSEKNVFDGTMVVAYANKFNPVLDYLGGLEWDGVSRVEKLFADYFCCGDSAYTRAVAMCFAVGAVRRMRKPGCKFDTMPVLKSPQGWKKSSAIATLFGAAWFSDAELGNLRDPDASLKLRGIWVQEFAEIESLTRGETGTLKAFVSRAVDRQRVPYGRVPENFPRRCLFCASVNEGGYLKDGTGGRRFWPLDLTAPIDLDRLAADRDQIWAEAAHLESSGVSDVLPESLWAAAAERQKAQTTEDPWADTVREFLAERAARAAAEFESCSDSDFDEPALPDNRVHTSELFDLLGIDPGKQWTGPAQRLRTIMEAGLGWRHIRNVRIGGKNRAGYLR